MNTEYGKVLAGVGEPTQSGVIIRKRGFHSFIEALASKRRLSRLRKDDASFLHSDFHRILDSQMLEHRLGEDKPTAISDFL
jgi:hypothetical protein